MVARSDGRRPRAHRPAFQFEDGANSSQHFASRGVCPVAVDQSLLRELNPMASAGGVKLCESHLEGLPGPQRLTLRQCRTSAFRRG